MACYKGFYMCRDIPRTLFFRVLSQGKLIERVNSQGPVYCSVRKTLITFCLWLYLSDIESEFRIIPMHPDSYHLFGFKWGTNFIMISASQWTVLYLATSFRLLAPPYSGFCKQSSVSTLCLTSWMTLYSWGHPTQYNVTNTCSLFFH